MITSNRALLSISCILFFFTNSFSQRPDFNQLKEDILKAKNQKEKAQAMMVYGGALSPREADKILNYADSVLLLAEDQGNEFYENASDYLKAVGFYKKGELSKAKKLFKSASIYFDDETYFKCLNFLGIIYLRSNKADSAVLTFNNILEKADKNNLSARLSAHGYLGQAYRRLGRYEESISNFEECVNIDSTNQFSILNSYLNIAGMYLDMEFMDKGISILKQVNISTYPPQPVVIAYYSNLGQLFYRNKQKDSALYYLNKGLDLAVKLRQPQQSMGNRLIQAKIYLELNQFETALEFLNAAKNDMKFYSPFPVKMDYNAKKATYFNKVGIPDSAITIARRNIQLAAKNRTPMKVANTYQIIAEAYEMKGYSDSSSFYLKLHDQSRTDQLKAGKEQFAQNAKARYMLAQKEKEVEDTKAESSILKQWQKWSLGLLVILSFVSLYIYLRLKKSNSVTNDKVVQNRQLKKQLEKDRNALVELKSKAILPIDEIVSIKADGHYLEFKLISKPNPEVDRNQLKFILANLPSKFVQIHRSYAVNVEHIKVKQASKVILKDGTELPVSRTFKNQLNEALDLM